MKTKIIKIIPLILASFLLSQATYADLKPLKENELREISGGNAIENVFLLQKDLNAFIQDGNGNVDADQIKNFLQDRANTLGLRLNDFTIKGVSYGGFPMVIQMDGESIARIELTSHIDEIHIGAITVNSNNPNNRSFGAIDIKGIDMSGSRIYVNFSSTSSSATIPILPAIVH